MLNTWAGFLQTLVSAALGGLVAVAATWVADHRKTAREDTQRQQRERVILTAVFAIRNHIASTLNDSPLAELNDFSELNAALTALNKLIDKMPLEHESLAISLVELSLKVDTLLNAPSFDRVRTQQRVDEVLGCLEMLDVLTTGSLTMVDADQIEDLAKEAS